MMTSSRKSSTESACRCFAGGLALLFSLGTIGRASAAGSNAAAPKSNAAAPKSNAAAPKSNAAAPKSSAATSKVSAATPANAASVNLNFEHAQALYAAGDMADSLKYLDLVLRVSPNDASPHYLKANCLVFLKRYSEAVTEYSMVEKLLPKSTLATYSQTAIARIVAMPSDQTASFRSNGLRGNNGSRGVNATRAGSNSSADQSDDDDDSDAPEKTSADQKNGAVPSNIETIRKQAAQARARQAEIGRAEAEGEIEKANNQVKSLQERVAREAAHSRNSTEPSAMSSEQVEAARNLTSQSAERLREQGKWKAEIKQWEAQEKVDELKQQAENLENRLLHEPVGPISDVRLNPIGTNLYTRNYASVPSRIVPLRAEAKPLNGTSAALLRTSGTIRSTKSTTTNSNLQTSAQVSATGGASLQQGTGQQGMSQQGVGQHHVVSTVKGQVVRP